MKALRWIVGILAVVAWIAVPVVVASVLTARSERSVQSPPITSAWMPAGEVEAEMSRRVVAFGTLGQAPPILAPAWTGLVEEVGLRPGEPLRSGETVAIVSGVPRLALHTPRPFHRPLGPGDRGVDVAELNTWLRARGHEASEGDRFASATRRGVRALRRDLGVPDPEVPPPAPAGEVSPSDPGGTGSAPDPGGTAGAPTPGTMTGVAGPSGMASASDPTTSADSFDPAWVVYLPAPEVTISSVSLQVGAPVPPPGSVVAEIEAQVTSVQLFEPDPSGSVSAPSVGGGAGAPAAGAGGGSGATDPTGPDPTGPGSGGPGPAAAGGSPGGGTSGPPLTAAAEGAVLRQGGGVLGPVAADGSIPGETLMALLPLLEGRESLLVDLVEPAPAGARAVPAAALFTGPTGSSCVATRAEPGGPVSVVAALQVTVDADRIVLAGLPDGPLEVEINAAPATRRRCQG